MDFFYCMQASFAIWSGKKEAKWVNTCVLNNNTCISACLMEDSCLSVLPFYLSYQLALATFTIQQMFIEPELEVIPLAFSVKSQENFHLLSQEIMIFVPL